MSFWSAHRLQTGFLGISVFLCTGGGVGFPQTVKLRRAIVPDGDPLPIFLQPQALLTARWAWGRLVGVEENESNEPLLYAIRSDEPPERIRFAIPGSGFTRVYDVAAGPDGTVALSGSAYSADGKAGTFVAWIAPDRKSQTVSRTWPYVPFKLTLAADGSIWTVGWILPPPGINAGSQNNVLKRFDKTGRERSTFTLRARPRPDSRDAVMSSELRASGDRIGWLTNGMEYIELSLGGRELDRFEAPAVPRPSDVLSLALSVDNEVVIGTVGGGKWNIWALDRERRAWIPSSVSGSEEPALGRLRGFDGPSLVADFVDLRLIRTRGHGGVLQRFRISAP
ncbi:MAG: hypothetical protein HYR60_15065 [Acidobacteria bacterium]|nr:hypothetical protein [Acidobacteriota bacterium]